MRSVLFGMPGILAGARIACTSAVAALAVTAGLLVPVEARAAEAGATPGRYENTSGSITYTGSWTTASSAADSAGSYANLNADGAAQITFSGTGITWVTRTNNFSGLADVYLDGTKKATVDLYSATSRTKQTVWSAAGLTDGTHTLKLVRTGTKNDASTGRNVTLDYLDVVDTAAPSAPTGLDATASSTTSGRVGLAWSASPEADVAGYAVYRASGSGAYAKVSSGLVTTTGFVDDGLGAGTYGYQVSAMDRSGNESARSTAASVTVAGDAPAPTPTPTPTATPTPTPTATPTPTVTPVGAGTYENDDPAVTLNGTWTKVSSSSDSGGSTSTLSTAGHAELTFTTSGIRWITRLNSYSGMADVYLDGVKKATVDLYSASTRTQQVAYEVTGLPEVPHTLRVVRTGTKNAASSSPNIALDAFVAPDVHAPDAPTGANAGAVGPKVTVGWNASPEADLAGYHVYRAVGTEPWTKVSTTLVTGTSFVDDGLAPGTTYGYQVSAVDKAGNESDRSATTSVTTDIRVVGQGTYENDDPAVTLFGAWSKASSAQDSGGSTSTLTGAGYAELSFGTSGIRWTTRLNSYSGIADVYVDGVKKATVDLYSATTRTQQVVFEVNDLTEATHTIRVVRTGTKNPASSSVAIAVDSFAAFDNHAPAAPTGLAATADGTSRANLAWTAGPEADIAGYNVFQSSADGTAVKVNPALVTGTAWVADGLAPGSAYGYQVSAVDSSGNESERSSVATATTSINAVGQGTYENDDPALTLNGGWTTVTSNQDSGGSAGSLTGPGYAEISFTTSGVRWLTRLNSYSGVADVYLDGVRQTTVDLYSATTKTQQVAYEVTGLPETTHTLRVVRTGAKNASSTGSAVMLDAFVAPDIHAPGAPTGLTAAVAGNDVQLAWDANPERDLKSYLLFRTEGTGARTLVATLAAGTTTATDPDRTPGLAYTYEVLAMDTSDNGSGSSSPAAVTMPIDAKGAGVHENDGTTVTTKGDWSVVASGMDSGGSYSSLNADGYAEISFATSGIRWVSRLNGYSGIADVYLDGVRQTSVDLYSATTQYQQVVYEASGLTETPHTLRIVRTGLKNAASSSPAIVLDAFVAPDLYPPAAPNGLVVTPARGSAQLTWTANPEADVVGYRVQRASDDQAPVVVNTAPVAATTFTDEGLQPGTTYTYRVLAVDAMGNESPLSVSAQGRVPMVAVPAGTYEDDDTDDILLKGSWTRTASTGAGTDSGSSFSTLGDAGYAEMSFATSGIRWLARTNSSSGLADVYIDGVRNRTVDLYSPTTRYAQNVFEVSGLPETGHTIRIVRTGGKNDDSVGRNITLDALVAPDIYPPGVPTALKASGTRTGAKLTWTRSTANDVASYRVFRRGPQDSTSTLIGTTGADATSFADVGLAEGASYTWTVVARDTSGNDSPTSLPASFTSAGDPYASFGQRYASCPTATVTVSTRAQLLSAVSGAGAGTVIRLNPGSYGANIDVTTKATADRPLWICGPRTAVFDNGNITKGYGFKINAGNNVVLAGMTVRNVQKGITVMYGKAVTIADLRVEDIGDEAIHLKNQTRDSTVIGNSVARTGLSAKNYGEGIYIGTAEGNWCLYNGCAPDTSDRNLVAFNDVSATTAEPIEAKAGTSDGTLWKNTLDGAGVVASDSDSLVQVMGSGWVVAGNVGTRSPGDAIQVWTTEAGYGQNNIVYANRVTDALPGYGVRMPFVDGGNVVGCDNAAPAAALGMSNKTCQG